MHFAKHRSVFEGRRTIGLSALFAAQLLVVGVNCGGSSSSGVGGAGGSGGTGGIVGTGGSGGTGGIIGTGGSGGTGGANSGTSKTIDAQGGELPVPGGGTMKIPAGALPKATTITIQQTSSLPALPSGLTGVGPAYEFGPDGLTFDKPITIEVPVAAGHPQVAFYSIHGNGPWEKVQGAFKSASVFEAKLAHFSGGQLADTGAQGTGGAGGATSSSSSASSSSVTGTAGTGGQQYCLSDEDCAAGSVCGTSGICQSALRTGSSI